MTNLVKSIVLKLPVIFDLLTPKVKSSIFQLPVVSDLLASKVFVYDQLVNSAILQFVISGQPLLLEIELEFLTCYYLSKTLLNPSYVPMTLRVPLQYVLVIHSLIRVDALILWIFEFLMNDYCDGMFESSTFRLFKKKKNQQQQQKQQGDHCN